MTIPTLQKCVFAGVALFAAASLQASVITITSTITVAAGATYNGNGNTIKAVGMGDGGQGESQKPFFRLGSGSRVGWLTLAAPGVDGIHYYGSGTIHTVIWADVGEDAWTVKSGGTTDVKYSKAYNATDKVGQVNAAATTTYLTTGTSVSQTVERQNGGTSFTCTFYYNDNSHSNCKGAIGRTDSSSTKFRYRNLTAPNFTGSKGWWYGRSSQASTY
jgi:pectate lyase C